MNNSRAMLAAIIEGLFAVWFLLSVLVHIPALRTIRRRVKIAGLLPNWYLFTSEILMYDLCLRFRTISADQWTDWQDLPIALKTGRWRIVWNPERRMSKTLLDSADAIIQARLSGARDRILESVPFRVLLDWARRHAKGAEMLQFCIALRAELRPASRPSILYLSPSPEKHAHVD